MLLIPFLKNDREDPALNNLKVNSGGKPVNLPIKELISKKKINKIKSKFNEIIIIIIT
jgi:hypothetical protein